MFFVCSAGFKLDMNPALIPYSIGFAVTYGMTVMFSMIALNYGSMSLTSLVTSYSLIIPTFYGLLFLGDPSGPFLYVGLVLLFASLTLINLRKGDMKISGKWYYFDKKTLVRASGWKTINGRKCYFDSKGVLKKGKHG